MNPPSLATVTAPSRPSRTLDAASNATTSGVCAGDRPAGRLAPVAVATGWAVSLAAGGSGAALAVVSGAGGASAPALGGALALLGGLALFAVGRRGLVARRVDTGRLLALQRKLAEAERALDRGHWGGALAHELRNPLAGVQMALVNLRRDVGDADLQARLGNAYDEVMRISRVVDALVDEVVPGCEPASEVGLSALVADVRGLVVPQLRRGVRLRVALHDRPGRAALPGERLRQALVLTLLHLAGRLPDAGGALRLDVTRGEKGTIRFGLSVRARELLQAPGRERAAPLTMIERLARETGGRFTRHEAMPGEARLELCLPDAMETTASDHVRDPAPDRRREAAG